MSANISVAIEPLVKRGIFDTEEEAIRELLREYVLQQISILRHQVDHLENKYNMRFQEFSDYLHQRSVLLESGNLSLDQRQVLGQAIMQEEDDWLDWKAAMEMIESWLGISQEIGA